MRLGRPVTRQSALTVLACSFRAFGPPVIIDDLQAEMDDVKNLAKREADRRTERRHKAIVIHLAIIGSFSLSS